MGIVPSMLTESLPPASKFSMDDIPDLTGKVAIVTGANTGVGKETVRALLAHNAKVYLAARNSDKAKAAIEDLRAQMGKDALFLKLDLADLRSVKAAAEEFVKKEKELHILFNNGGVMVPPINELTVDGYDLQFGTNVLGHYYFTKLLLPTLISTAQSSPEKHVRVLTTSSITHYLGSLNFNTFKEGPARRKLGTLMLYTQSKYGDLVLAMELARRYDEQGIVSMAVNPGNLDTDLTRHLNPVMRWLFRLGLYPLPQGALTQLWGATSREGAGFNGKYLAPWARVREPRSDALDPVLGKQLWEWLEEQVKEI
ncbi:hypothetical protein C0995_006579 [Termitomyces sp. Mi166|nr:hypothetical protein C0995_006579 [Termitomyces sp. Mi166\